MNPKSQQAMKMSQKSKVRNMFLKFEIWNESCMEHNMKDNYVEADIQFKQVPVVENASLVGMH